MSTVEDRMNHPPFLPRPITVHVYKSPYPGHGLLYIYHWTHIDQDVRRTDYGSRGFINLNDLVNDPNEGLIKYLPIKDKNLIVQSLHRSVPESEQKLDWSNYSERPQPLIEEELAKLSLLLQ